MAWNVFFFYLVLSASCPLTTPFLGYPIPHEASPLSELSVGLSY